MNGDYSMNLDSPQYFVVKGQATLDDLVDAYFLKERHDKKHKDDRWAEVLEQSQVALVYICLTLGIYLLGGSFSQGLIALITLTAGVLLGRLTKRTFIRKALLPMMEGQPTLPTQTTLSPDDIITTQGRHTTIFQWSEITEIEDTPTIRLWAGTLGVVNISKCDFESRTQQLQFLEFAHHQLRKSLSTTRVEDEENKELPL